MEILLAAMLLTGSVWAGDRDVPGVQIGVSSERAPFISPPNLLDRRITINLIKVPLKDLLAEVSRQTRLRFHYVGGVENCVVSAMLRNVPARQALGATIEIGLTYQQLGRSDTYTITPPFGNRPLCPRINLKATAERECEVGGEGISARCDKASLLSFVQILHERSESSFLFSDGAEDASISLNLRKSKLEKAIKKIEHLDGITIKKWPEADTFIIKAES